MLAKELVKTCTFAQTNRLWHFTALPNTCERLCLQLLKAAYKSSVFTNSYSEPIMMPNMDWSKSKYAYIQYCRLGWDTKLELVCFLGIWNNWPDYEYILPLQICKKHREGCAPSRQRLRSAKTGFISPATNQIRKCKEVSAIYKTFRRLCS